MAGDFFKALLQMKHFTILPGVLTTFQETRTIAKDEMPNVCFIDYLLHE